MWSRATFCGGRTRADDHLRCGLEVLDKILSLVSSDVLLSCGAFSFWLNHGLIAGLKDRLLGRARPDQKLEGKWLSIVKKNAIITLWKLDDRCSRSPLCLQEGVMYDL